MTPDEQKEFRAGIAKHVYENIEFIEQQISLFCAWVQEYSDTLHAKYWRLPEQRESNQVPPDGYMPALPGDFFCLQSSLVACPYMTIWRPIEMNHPLGYFGLLPSLPGVPGRIVDAEEQNRRTITPGDVSRLTRDQQIMRDCVTLGRVYCEEMLRVPGAKNPFRGLPKPGWDLERFLMFLGSRLAEPDGNLLIQQALDDVQHELVKLGKKRKPPKIEDRRTREEKLALLTKHLMEMDCNSREKRGVWKRLEKATGLPHDWIRKEGPAIRGRLSSNGKPLSGWKDAEGNQEAIVDTSKCRRCGDQLTSTWECPMCDETIDQECPTCHLEICKSKV